MSEYQLSDLLEKHEKGNCTEQEKLILQRYFDSFQDGQEIWNSFSEGTREKFKAQIFSNVSRQIDDYESVKPARRFGIRKVAATLLLLAAASVAYFYLKPDAQKLSEITMITRTAERGQKVTLQLNDGSRIRLNGGSSITFPEEFTDARQITLTGEAFFEVAKSEVPFQVTTGDLITTVKGTSFNIKTGIKNSTQVTVATGRVEVRANDHVEVLTPGQQVRYTKNDQKMTIRTVDVNHYIVWREGILLFDGENLEQAAMRLSNWFGVDFKFKDKQRNLCDLKLRFDNPTLAQVMEQMELITGTTHHFEDEKKITITGIGCTN